MSERTLNMLIIGPSGAGKSWLASTVPPPRLVVDLEGRAKYTPNGRGATWWDGVSDPKKLTPSKTHTYAVTVTSLEILDSVRQWLRSGKHPFRSVAVDSLMEFQLRVADKIRPGTQALRELDWGTLLRHSEQFVRDVRDMTLVPATGVRCAVFVAGCRKDQDHFDSKTNQLTEAGHVRPLMQGQINLRLPYIVDVVGYLEAVAQPDGTIVRRLWIGQRPQNDLDVKDGTNDLVTRYGAHIDNPDLETLYNALLPEA